MGDVEPGGFESGDAGSGDAESVPTGAELDGLTTEELRHHAFAQAMKRRDVSFFWSIFRHLPHAEDAETLDASIGAVGASVNDAVALWREFTGHGYGDSEPLLRAAFIAYLQGAELP
jgi:hypothetical protein